MKELQQFVKANSVEEAIKALSEIDNSMIVAGGTDVIVKMRDGKLSADALVDISGIDELRGIKEENGYIVIGGLTCINDIAASDLIKEKAKVLWDAAQVFADSTIRNSATIAGNIVSASPAADTAPGLLVLNAEVILQGADGERIVPMTEWYVKRKTVNIAKSEVVKALRFKPVSKSAFKKLGLREAIVISVLSAGVGFELEADGTVKDCRIAMGAEQDVPVRCYNAEKSLIGKKVDEAALDLMSEELQKDINPHDGAKASGFYRRNVGVVYLKRAIEAALA